MKVCFEADGHIPDINGSCELEPRFFSAGCIGRAFLRRLLNGPEV